MQRLDRAVCSSSSSISSSRLEEEVERVWTVEIEDGQSSKALDSYGCRCNAGSKRDKVQRIAPCLFRDSMNTGTSMMDMA